jgi:hypothetical protein
MAWRLWALFFLYFTSGVFFVNLCIAAARLRCIPDFRTRWRAGRAHLLYHAALAAAVLSIPWSLGGRAAAFLMLAYAPVLVRAVCGWARLGGRAPTLKRVGQHELVYAMWFAACVAAWLHVTL